LVASAGPATTFTSPGVYPMRRGVVDWRRWPGARARAGASTIVPRRPRRLREAPAMPFSRAGRRLAAILVLIPMLFPAARPAAAATLAVPFLSQYAAADGGSRRDSGPASVAMVVKLFFPERSLDAGLLAEARAYATGAPDSLGDTGFVELERALAAYGLGYSEVSMGLRPAPEAQVRAMQSAVEAGKPVLAFLHGPSLGRRTTPSGADYGDFWLVVTGFSADGRTVYVNDPDTADPPADNPSWR